MLIAAAGGLSHHTNHSGIVAFAGRYLLRTLAICAVWFMILVVTKIETGRFWPWSEGSVAHDD